MLCHITRRGGFAVTILNNIRQRANHWLVASLVCVGLLAASAFLVAAALRDATNAPKFQPHTPASASVLLEDKSGHGSGIHIGNGYILSAAHVVETNKSMTAVLSDKSTLDATVLWANAVYDIALLRVDNPDRLESAPLSCAANYPGQHIRAFGNPLDLTFVWSSGEVVGDAREAAPWASAVPIDGTVVFGQSGGGVLDDNGNVVGITVGVMTAPVETGYHEVSTSVTGFGFVVPASVVCTLLARQ